MQNSKFYKVLDFLTNFVGSCTLVFMISCTSFNVIGRFFFNYSLKWAEEYAYLFFCWVVFIGAAACYNSRSLISINVFVLMLPEKVQQVIFIIKRILMFVVNIWLFYIAVQFTINGARKLTTLLHIPYYYHYVSVAILFLLAILFSFRDMILAVLRKEVADTQRHAE